LLVEDSLTTREFERSLLEAHGYAVETAVDGVDGLEKVRGDHKFDLVVTDIEMPRMNGFDFCEELRRQPELHELPIVVVTTMDKEEEKRRGIEAGAQAYIIKGAFNQNALLQTIEKLIGTVE
jgi:CheY-like chemotaxis protein